MEEERPKKIRKLMSPELTKQDLLHICRLNRWRNYSNLNRDQLLLFVRCARLKERRAKRVIATKFAPFVKIMCNESKVVNSEDPFTLEEIPPTEKIFLRMSARFVYQFNAKTLLRFFCTEGSFKNPYTLQEISNFSLRKLHHRYFEIVPTNSWLVIEFNEEHQANRNKRLIITNKTDIVQLRKTLTRIKQEERHTADLIHMLGQEFVEQFDRTMKMLRSCEDAPMEVISVAWLVMQLKNAQEMRETLHNIASLSISSGKLILRNCINVMAMETIKYNLEDIRLAMANNFLKEMMRMYSDVFHADYSSTFVSLAHTRTADLLFEEDSIPRQRAVQQREIPSEETQLPSNL